MKVTSPYCAELGVDETILLKFGAKGTVKATGSFKVLQKGKEVVYKPVISTVLVPLDAEAFEGAFVADVYLHFPPKPAQNFPGCTTVVRLKWDDFMFEL